MAKEDRVPASQDKIPVSEANEPEANQLDANEPAEQQTADNERRQSKSQAKSQARSQAAADQRREADLAEATAELAVQQVYLEAARRTGWSLSEAEDNMKRLREKGDYFDEKGRWTLDTAGWPVCLEGWKPEKIEAP